MVGLLFLLILPAVAILGSQNVVRSNVTLATTIPTTLSSVIVSPSRVNLSLNGSAVFSAAITCTGGPCPSGANYSWSLSNALGTLNSTQTSVVKLTVKSSAGVVGVFVNVTLGGKTVGGNGVASVAGPPISPKVLADLLVVTIIAVAIIVIIVLILLMLFRRKGRSEKATHGPSGHSNEAFSTQAATIPAQSVHPAVVAVSVSPPPTPSSPPPPDVPPPPLVPPPEMAHATSVPREDESSGKELPAEKPRSSSLPPWPMVPLTILESASYESLWEMAAASGIARNRMLVFSTDLPGVVAGQYGLSGAAIWQIARTEGENTVSPENLERFSYLIENHLGKAAGGTVVIGGLQMLIDSAGIKNVRRLLQVAREIAQSTRGAVLVAINPDTLTAIDLRRMEEGATIVRH